ncbi:HNH endonuclease, partial [Mycobacteroides abscessus subsp. massiliense]
GIEQAKEFYNHPGEFIGKNLIHGTEALAGGAVGGEAAAGARGLLGDLTGTEGRALTHGLDNPHPAPTVEHGGGGGGGGGIGGDHTSGVGDHGGGPGGHGMPGGNPTPFDFDTPIDT